MAKSTGTVKWFDATKGFGFITPAGGGDDLFVHQTSIQTEGYRSLREGEEVEFVVESGDDGRTKATQVTGPNGAPPLGGGDRQRGGFGGGGGFGGQGGYGGGQGGYGGGGGGYGGGGGGFGGGGRGGGGGACYECNQPGHIARDCPNRRGGGGGGSYGGGGGGYGGGQQGGYGGGQQQGYGGGGY